ncbi:glycosyltransferase [Cyanobium sp. ATX 6A2]|uniref:glycosyltransferase n=1 Tax=Cyanobium sp. ATX 6A2 TaxID=2823700 RepID=UPI0020CD9432|nr:glycosyltransferase [Cyanobium sp. ATX 6A2]
MGGGGIYAKRLSDALSQAGHPSSVLSTEAGALQPRGGGWPLFDRVLAGVLHRCATQTMHSFLRQTRWRSHPSIRRADAVHLHSVTGFIGFAGLQDLIPDGAMVFWTAHNPWLFTGGCVVYTGCDRFEEGCRGCPILPPAVRGWAQLDHGAKQRFALERRVQPVANSEWMAALMKRSSIYGQTSDIPVVPPIVDRVFRPDGDGRALRAQFGIAPERYVIGLSARAVTDLAKGIGQFFAALPVGWQPLSNVTFLILGDGRIPMPSSVDHRFAGLVEGAHDLLCYYRAMDIFVSPSAMETFGMALLEAQACGIPVVAFSTGGTPEAVCPYANCHLVQNGDFAAMFDALRAVILEGRPTIQLSDALHRWVDSRHGAGVIARKQIGVYQRHGFDQIAHY